MTSTGSRRSFITTMIRRFWSHHSEVAACVYKHTASQRVNVICILSVTFSLTLRSEFHWLANFTPSHRDASPTWKLSLQCRVITIVASRSSDDGWRSTVRRGGGDRAGPGAEVVGCGRPGSVDATYVNRHDRTGESTGMHRMHEYNNAHIAKRRLSARKKRSY